MGNGSSLRYGDVQRMSAGTGVQHSEFNHSASEAVHFLQIWIEPSAKGLAPGYEEKHFDAASKTGQLRMIASPDGADGSVLIHQDARIFASILDGAAPLRHALAPGRLAYVHVIRGAVSVNGVDLGAGDAAKLAEVDAVLLERGQGAEILLFDLPR